MTKITYEVKGYESAEDFDNRLWTAEFEYIPTKKKALAQAKKVNTTHPVVKIQSSDREWIEIIGNTTPEDQRPELMLQGMHLSLLQKIIRGDINIKEIALKEIDNRGVDIEGAWVGLGEYDTKKMNRMQAYFERKKGNNVSCRTKTGKLIFKINKGRVINKFEGDKWKLFLKEPVMFSDLGHDNQYKVEE